MSDQQESIPHAWGLCRGDLVEVRSAEEILATLTTEGTLEKLPCMPEMLAWCGQQLRVESRAHKLCDTIENTGARHMQNAVHLEGVRCDGSAHGGCEANCLVVWKEAWLKPVEPRRRSDKVMTTSDDCDHDALQASTQPEPDRYKCQATELRRATQRRRYWDPRFYWEDWKSGNVRIGKMMFVLVLRSLHIVQCRIGRGYRLTVWMYNLLARVAGYAPFPYRPGTLKGKTPQVKLDLQPGELVRVKSQDEILKTLAGWTNRGMRFDPEMVPWCGKTFRVKKRLRQIINEETGRMIELKNDCIVLEGPYCLSVHSNLRLFCTRANTPYWREIWLERVEEQPPRDA